MADRKDKRSRKEALDRWKSEQRAAARAKLPLPDDQMQALFDMLDGRNNGAAARRAGRLPLPCLPNFSVINLSVNSVRSVFNWPANA
jgi:hypothetical protein